jgi:hypothetical protein
MRMLMYLGFLPLNHGDFQNGAILPLHIEIVVEAYKRYISISSHKGYPNRPIAYWALSTYTKAIETGKHTQISPNEECRPAKLSGPTQWLPIYLIFSLETSFLPTQRTARSILVILVILVTQRTELHDPKAGPGWSTLTWWPAWLCVPAPVQYNNMSCLLGPWPWPGSK